MQCLRLAAILTLTSALAAQDPQLEALRDTLATLRKQTQGAAFDTPIPAAPMAKAKHQLRDWIESKLASLKTDQEVPVLEVKLNQELQSLGMLNEEPEGSRFGTLGHLRLRQEGGLVTLATSVGILCQNDQSAYAYQKKDGRWQRIWESEERDYSTGKYAPQHIFAIHVFRPKTITGDDRPPLVMTLGNEWGCGSFWHLVYYRVWRIDPTGPKLLINGSQQAWLRLDDFATGTFRQDPYLADPAVDVLLEFTVSSVDTGVGRREAVFRYRIDGDHARRIDPIAFTPRNFVEEWLTHDWPESSGWSTSEAVRPWHNELHAEGVSGQFQRATKRCQSPGLWQVAFAPSGAEAKPSNKPPRYFLIEWHPPFQFTLKDVSAKPWPDCTQDDPEADEWRTLFSTQQWRN
ncbi:hypothetical protein [Paludibaculum fermentans]|uniref:hypothetical protein n=1 Tax=Paludibaculum fermentans TaxID=1473598 RepID=UPI003EBBD7B5